MKYFLQVVSRPLGPEFSCFGPDGSAKTRLTLLQEEDGSLSLPHFFGGYYENS